jgi:hypothetical protein
MQQLTPQIASDLQCATTELSDILAKAAAGNQPSAGEWNILIARLLEQVGPILLQLLIASLLQPQVAEIPTA